MPAALVYAITNVLQTTGATPGVWQSINYNNDITVVLNGLIDRPTPARFRTLVRGYFFITYTMNVYMAANTRGVTFRVFKNGTTDANITSDNNAQNDPVKSNGSSVGAVIELQANDYIEVQANPHDASAANIKATSSIAFHLLRVI
jgi:hypothetical protein